MGTFWRDLRHAARMLARSPGFTIVGGLILALGIGANTAIFSIVDAVLLRPLPYQHPDRLVSIKDDLRGLNIADIGMSVPELWDFRDRSGIFDEISAVWPISGNLTGSDHPERVEALAVSWNYFHLLGVTPKMGRVFNQQEDTPGFAEGAIISDNLWRRMFGSDPHILGRKLRIDNDMYAIVGVMPAGFRHPGRTIQNDVEVWITAGFAADPFAHPPQRNSRQLPGAVALLKSGLSQQQAQSKLDAFTAQLSRDFPNEYPAKTGWNARLVPLQEDLVGQVRSLLLIVLGAVGLVLLICCVSLANLVLARSSSRQRETAVRLALGAPRSHLIRLLISESVLLSLFGGTAGLLMVVWMRAVLVSIAPANLPRLNEVGLSWSVLAFALGTSLLTGVLFGLAPALQLSNTNLVANLKEGSRGTSVGSKQARFRGILVACEVALSLMLMVGGGLLLRSFANLLQVSPGFNANHVLLANLWMPAPNNPQLAPYPTPQSRTAFVREVLRRARTLPGVELAAMGSGTSIPLTHWNSVPIAIENRTQSADEAPSAQLAAVSPDYFRTLQARLVKGRFFTDSDDPQSMPAALIDEAAARRFFPNQDPLNKRVRFGRNPRAPWLTVVGVVGDIKTDGLDVSPAPHVFFSVYQNSNFAMTVFLRTASDPAILGEALRREIQNVDRDMPVFGVKTLDEVVSTSLSQRRFAMEMVGAFAVVALMLAAIGIYGVTAFSVSQRTQEIGIRIALGAKRADVLKLVLRQGLSMVLWGLAGGLAGAFVLTRFLRSLLFAESPADPVTFITVSAVLAATAVVACYIPAIRAMRVDPIIALRCE
jgi:predicted permease